jgi:hypothetical protein
VQVVPVARRALGRQRVRSALEHLYRDPELRSGLIVRSCRVI